MQFEVAKQSLLKAISNVSGAVERKNTIPVLQNIKIEAQKTQEGDKVILSATDMDILVTATFEADIKKSGVTTVPAQMFFDIVRKIPEGAIMISQESPTILQIKSGKSKYSLPCIDATEFPNLSEGELGEEITIKSEDLMRMIEKHASQFLAMKLVTTSMAFIYMRLNKVRISVCALLPPMVTGSLFLSLTLI